MSYKNKDSDTPQESVSEWNGCCAQGCPIAPSVSAGGNRYCTFHYGNEYGDFDSITGGIKKNLEHYLFYRRIILLNPKEFKDRTPNMVNYKFCPLQDDEKLMAVLYEQRLFKRIKEQVRIDAGL